MNSSVRDGAAVEVLVERAGGKMVNRFVIPGLLILLSITISIIGFFGAQTLSRIETAQGGFVKTQTAQGEVLAQVKSDVRVVNNRLDERVLRELDDLRNGHEDQEKRLQTLERATGTP